MTWVDVPGDRLKEPEITFEDFKKSLRNSRPSVSPSDIQQHIKFTEEFGQEVKKIIFFSTLEINILKNLKRVKCVYVILNFCF